jgi:hypothetical protein
VREQRKRKALYVNRREELYPAALLEKERSAGKKKTKPAVRKSRPAGSSSSARPTPAR